MDIKIGQSIDGLSDGVLLVRIEDAIADYRDALDYACCRTPEGEGHWRREAKRLRRKIHSLRREAAQRRLRL